MRHSRILMLMFCMGAYAILSQILLLREFLVAFFGNELAIGAIFSAWLLLIGVGSCMATFLVARWPAKRLRALLVVLLILAAFLLPLQIWVIRIVRNFFHVAYGEYAPFFSMLASLVAILAPGCLIVGIVFPCACRLAARQLPHAVSRVYTVESLGSMVAGASFSFWLVWIMSPLAVAVLAGILVLLGAAWLAVTRTLRWISALTALALMVLLCCPDTRAQSWPSLGRLERASVEVRWRSFGALPVSTASSTLASRLLASADSRYQNLALIATEGQITLYANGQVMTVFPDVVAGEHKIHFIMAQKPDVRRVLLIGGNPVNDIPELLKYPLEQLVHIELDDKINSLLKSVAPAAFQHALRDPRLLQVNVDAPRYVKQYKKGGGLLPFDAILVDAFEPATIALNRFYTQDFYRDLRSVLAPDGFLYTAIAASDDLQGETAFLSASIAKTLRTVFDRVLVTAGTKNQFFAGTTNSPITLARAPLFRNSSGAGIKTRYFRPEYFLNADEISPEKLDFVERQLAAIPVMANTVLQPVSTFYQVVLWSRLSASGLESLMIRLARLRLEWVVGVLLVLGAVCLGVGLLLGRRQAGVVTAARPCVALWRSEAIFSQGMLVLVMAATGLCGVALELILVFIFQALLGYVYAKIGLIVAMFMLGLTLGAAGCVPTLKMAGQWWTMVVMELLLAAVTVCIPWLTNALSTGLMNWIPWGWVEALVYGLIAGTGALIGAQFVLVNELLKHAIPVTPGGDRAGLGQGIAAAITNAADLAGAALGGLIVGVLLLPLFGVTATCFLLAALEMASLLCLLAAWRVDLRC